MICKNAKMLHLHFKRYPNSYNTICLGIYKIHPARAWISFSTSTDTNRAVSCLTASLSSSSHPLSAGYEFTEGFDQHVNKLNTSVRWVKADGGGLAGENACWRLWNHTMKASERVHFRYVLRPFLLDRIFDASHVGENKASVVAL